MTEPASVGLLDTSVIIDLPTLPPAELPERAAIAAITLAELGAGVHTTIDAAERAVRIARLQAVESALDPLPFDADVARCYSFLVAAVVAAGQQLRPRRLDLMIAATAYAHELPLYTRNPKDFSAVAGDVRIIAV